MKKLAPAFLLLAGAARPLGVVGILVRGGADDYVKRGSCSIVNTCPAAGC